MPDFRRDLIEESGLFHSVAENPHTEIQVECYAGYRAEETPRRFFIGERLIHVVSVIDRWATPDYRYFRVEGDDRRAYLLRLSADGGKWELV